LPTEETRSYRSWTKEEEQFLLEKARFLTYPQIAEKPTQTIQLLIGQLMIDGFCYPNSHFFVAIPKKEEKMLKRLEMIFDYYKMPIGILLVSNEVEIYRDNSGVFMK